MALTIQRTYCNCHPETCGCDPYELMLDGKKIANVYDPSGLTLVIKNIAAKDAENAELRQENRGLRDALTKAVLMYGKPGGPWNVPSEPGTWIMMAKESLGGE